MLPLNTTMTRHGSWHRLSSYKPKFTGLHLITVHPGGCEYWCYWSGFEWGTFASTEEQACLPYMYLTRMALPESMWFKGEAVVRVNSVRKEVRMFQSFKAPSSRKFVSTYAQFFGANVAAVVEPEVIEVAADPSVWEPKDKTGWFDSVVKPTIAGTYEAVDSLGFKGPVVFNGRKWETRVTKWRGLNTKAHAKAMKSREIDSHDF